MKDEKKPNYWAVIPADVLYDNELRPNAKLLYAQISALTNKSGYCYASNKYLSDLFGITPRALRQLIQQLVERQFLKVEVLRGDKMEVSERRIWLNMPAVYPSGKNIPDPSGNIVPHPLGNNFPEASGKKFPPNNKIINNIPPKAPLKGGRVRREYKQTTDWEADASSQRRPLSSITLTSDCAHFLAAPLQQKARLLRCSLVNALTTLCIATTFCRLKHV